MKNLLKVFVFVILCSTVAKPCFAYDFGDFSSVALTIKAWDSLSAKKYEDVVVYTNKCLELYTEEAKKMQDSLTDYIDGTVNKDKVFAYWALNDVSTCLFIKGKALLEQNKMEEAKQVFQDLVDNYKYGQCWDPKGWFWKPAEAAEEILIGL